MAESTAGELVWFKNKQTGRVEAAHKGTASYKRMLSEMTGGDEPELIWEKCKAPKVHEPTPFVSGRGPTFVAPGKNREGFDLEKSGEWPPEPEPQGDQGGDTK